MLEERRPDEVPPRAGTDILGELGEGLAIQARALLEARLARQAVANGEQVFAAGAAETDLLIVQSGRITLSTTWPPSQGMRVASVGEGMAFGEMAFLNGDQRSAFAGAENGEVAIARLTRAQFNAWAADFPADALAFMANLATIGTRRLGATTRQLRSALE